VNDVHPLAGVLDAAARGRFPAVDGAVEVLAPDAAGTRAVVAFTGHAFVLADVDPDDVATHGADGFGGAHAPRFVAWLAGPNASIGSLDVVLVAPGRGRRPCGIERCHDLDDHPRVARALAHRRDVQVWGDDGGLIVLGRGLVGRCELSAELLDDTTADPGHGRRLIDAGRDLVPAGEWCWAQVAAGNARSLRAFLAAGFVPVGSEILIENGGRVASF